MDSHANMPPVDPPAFFVYLRMHPPFAYLAFVVSILFGLRLSQVVRLTCQSVDLQAGILTIRSRKTKVRPTRVITISPEMAIVLGRYKAAMQRARRQQ